jgi:hypothetical protein
MATSQTIKAPTGVGVKWSVTRLRQALFLICYAKNDYTYIQRP